MADNKRVAEDLIAYHRFMITTNECPGAALAARRPLGETLTAQRLYHTRVTLEREKKVGEMLENIRFSGLLLPAEDEAIRAIQRRLGFVVIV